MGLYRKNGDENGNYYRIMWYIPGLYRKNGEENGNYYLGSRAYASQKVSLEYIGIVRGLGSAL